MSSAFRRKGATRPGSLGSSTIQSPSSSLLSATRGIKAWTGGIHLTSVGLNDLDTILGGGQPLGTSILLQEDRWTRDLALSLLKYWVAEAISQEQTLIIPVASKVDTALEALLASPCEASNSTFANKSELEKLLSLLPRNLHWDKEKKKSQQQGEMPQGLDVLEEEEDEAEGDAEEGLEIAWQYKKSVQEERSGLESSRVTTTTTPNTNVFCHSYDLSGRMKDQMAIQSDSILVGMPDEDTKATTTAHARGVQLFRFLASQIKRVGGKMVRMLLFHPNLEALTVALPLFMAYIRSNSLPVVLMVYVPSAIDQGLWSQLSRSADVVLSTEGFASRKEYPPPPEFRHLQGLLQISKVSTVTAATANGGGHFADLTASKRPAAFIYGFKRDRRKLHISLLHIPPEDYTEGGGSVGSGARSGAGLAPASSKSNNASMGCASNMSGSLLDF